MKMIRRVFLMAALVGASGAMAQSSPSVPIEQAREALEKGAALLLDVREPHEHAGGVAPGARLLPMSQLQARYPEIPKDRPVYAHAYVLGMGLLPPFRGRGVGTRLMTTVLAAARRAGLHRVELTVRESNTAAIALYRTMGFEVEGCFRDAVRVDGAYENVLGMARLF